jgi:hypothetical protein
LEQLRAKLGFGMVFITQAEPVNKFGDCARYCRHPAFVNKAIT